MINIFVYHYMKSSLSGFADLSCKILQTLIGNCRIHFAGLIKVDGFKTLWIYQKLLKIC